MSGTVRIFEMKLNRYGEHPDRRRIKRWEPFDSGFKPALLLSSQFIYSVRLSTNAGLQETTEKGVPLCLV